MILEALENISVCFHNSVRLAGLLLTEGSKGIFAKTNIASKRHIGVRMSSIDLFSQRSLISDYAQKPMKIVFLLPTAFSKPGLTFESTHIFSYNQSNKQKGDLKKYCLKFYTASTFIFNVHWRSVVIDRVGG